MLELANGCDLGKVKGSNLEDVESEGEGEVDSGEDFPRLLYGPSRLCGSMSLCPSSLLPMPTWPI